MYKKQSWIENVREYWKKKKSNQNRNGVIVDLRVNFFFLSNCCEQWVVERSTTFYLHPLVLLNWNFKTKYDIIVLGMSTITTPFFGRGTCLSPSPRISIINLLKKKKCFIVLSRDRVNVMSSSSRVRFLLEMATDFEMPFWPIFSPSLGVIWRPDIWGLCKKCYPVVWLKWRKAEESDRPCE